MYYKKDIKRERLERRNEAIREQFNKLWAKGLRLEIIYTQLAEQHALMEHTIRDIVSRKGNYNKVKSNQLELFKPSKK